MFEGKRILLPIMQAAIILSVTTASHCAYAGLTDQQSTNSPTVSSLQQPLRVDFQFPFSMGKATSESDSDCDEEESPRTNVKVIPKIYPASTITQKQSDRTPELANQLGHSAKSVENVDNIVIAALAADKKHTLTTVAAPEPHTTVTWEIELSDKTLNAALARWTSIAGWQLVWELPVDYAVEARTSVPGTFEEAVATVAKSMETAEVPIKAIFYQGNKVLRIVPKGVK